MALPIVLSQNLSAEQTKWMNHRFLALCQDLGVSVHLAQVWWQELYELYTGPKRYYHNLVHIYNFLHLLDQYKVHIENPIVFEIAVWWHDAIYDASRKDNETKSAALAARYWQPYLTTKALQLGVDLIESTAKHQPLVSHSDVNYFLDFDLGILGTDYMTYTIYSEAIWKEYKGAFPRLLYRIGRKKVLRKFLQRPQLFFTTTFYEQYEKQARDNITKEIASL